MDLYESAIRYLTIREHSRWELEQKLLKKSDDGAGINEVLDRLEGENYLSDERFCESFLRSRVKKNVEGKKLLQMRLQAKGVSSSLAKMKVEEFFCDNLEAIESAVCKKYQKVVKTKGEEKAKLMLYQKGLNSFKKDENNG